MDRERLEFRYFFNAGMDRKTGIVDGEGCDVIELDAEGQGHYIGSVYGVLPGEVSGMDDRELENMLAVNGIIPNL